MPRVHVLSRRDLTWPVVHVVGIGDDGAASLGAHERAIVAEADLLCGGARQLAFFPEHAGECFAVKSNIEALFDLLAGAPGRRRAVLLASGDPCFFGVGPLLAARLGRERVVIHPHVGSVALAFARLGLAWQDAAVLSAHGRPLHTIVSPALAAAKFAVLTDPDTNTPAAVAAALREAGMEDASAFVCEQLGGPRERIVASTLDGLRGQRFAPLNVLIVNREPAAVVRCLPAFGRPEGEYEAAHGQITKAEVRAVALSKLEPWRAAVAWDIGAGAGSLAIELAGLMPRGAVYAVEADPAQAAVLRRNLARFPRLNVCAHEGAAPDALAGLPAPDSVFVGGAGAALAAVLETAAVALRPGGRLVANFARLDSLAAWQAVAGSLGWAQEIVQVSIARGVPIGGGTRLAALNPVFVTTLRRPEEAES